MREKTVDVLIPVFKPPESFAALAGKLKNQTHPVSGVIILETVYEGMPETDFSAFPSVTVLPVRREDFDHGGTRHFGAEHSCADYLLFMTQDAVPADDRLVEELLQPFSDERTAVSYARQLPREKAGALERITREFNYPALSVTKTAADTERLGIKTYFCSDVCAMYDRKKYLSLGGFVRRTIFNEDMIFACGAVKSGYGIAYRAEAKVIHSHSYTGLGQLRRNFDMGVSQAEHPEVFGAVSSESEGLRLVGKTASGLVRSGKWFLIPEMIFQSGMKYLGYLLGKHYDRLSKKTVLALTSNRNYWRNENESDQGNKMRN